MTVKEMAPSSFQNEGMMECDQFFVPGRLKLARMRLGLTSTALAEMAGLSVKTLRRYELGQSEPNREAAERLANSLELEIGFFYEEMLEAVNPETVSFRKLSKTSAKLRDSALAYATLVEAFFNQIEFRFTLPSSNLPTLGHLAPEDAANRLRADWELGEKPIRNLLALLERKGIKIASLPQREQDVDAFCFSRDGRNYIVLNTSKSAERQRFDLAHELGHLILHAEVDFGPEDSKRKELEANQFAAAFLMPAARVYAQQLNGADLVQIKQAKQYWRVSAMAMTHRLKELGLLSDWQYRTSVVELAKQGYRRTEPDGLIPERSKLLEQVFYGQGAKIRFSEMATNLALKSQEVKQFVKGLIPVSL